MVSLRPPARRPAESACRQPRAPSVGQQPAVSVRVAAGPRILPPDPAHRRRPGARCCCCLSSAAASPPAACRLLLLHPRLPDAAPPLPCWTPATPPASSLQRVKGECFELLQLAFQAHLPQVRRSPHPPRCTACFLAWLLRKLLPPPSPHLDRRLACPARPARLQLIQRSLRCAGHRQDAYRRSGDVAVTFDPRRGVTQARRRGRGPALVEGCCRCVR